ncbi:unnamed protein product [Paramecium sonneborni]|uniref:Copper homeostasis protein cutC homolog n=1 Tax=Paramecium sonneborni TaxID=65129 RepID=A0A8S1R121_9CILI|nr:unnamed protein product [Paramecium sonneborni]
MIRPRGGDFVYNEEEFEIMIEDIKICKLLDIKEIVTGILTKNQQIDIERMKILINIASPIQVVFHMAIDDCSNYHESLQQLVDLGIKRVLTKGGQFKSAIDGKESIKQIVKLFPQLTILAGGGITKDNYVALAEYCHLKEVHGTKIV